MKRCKTTWNERLSLEKGWLDLTRKLERIQNDIILMPCAHLPCCIGLFDRDELEPTLHSDVAHPAISICWHGKEIPEIVRARISGCGEERCYLLGYDSGVGVRVPALGGQASERVRVQPAGEGDAGDDGDAEQREPPRRDEPDDQPGQERREVVDEVADLQTSFHFRPPHHSRQIFRHAGVMEPTEVASEAGGQEGLAWSPSRQWRPARGACR